MIQGEGTNPQAGKVTVDEFAAKIKEKYPEYKDVDNLKLAQAIVEKYPEYKEAVIFEPAEPVKKKDGNIPSASLDGESPSFLSEVNTFFQPTYDAADWVNKNIPVWSNWASVSTQLAGGITKAVDGLVKEATLNFMPDSEYKESIKKEIQEKGINQVLDTPIESIAENLSLYGEEIKQKRLENYGVDLEEQQLGILKNIGSGNLSAAATLAVDGATDGIIQSGLAALTGVAPLAISAGGEKYYDVSNKPNYSSSERILYSSAVGLMEGLIESVFASDIKAFGKVLDSDLALKGFEKELLSAAKNTPWYKEFLKMGTEEGLEESLSESFGQMLTGFKEGTRPDPIAIAEAFVMGFLPGAGTHVITNGISAIGSEQRTKRRQELAKRIEEAKAKVEEVEDPAQKAILEEMAKDDIDELNKEIGLDAELYAGFSEEDVNEIQSINTEIRNLYQKIGLAVDEDQKNAYKKQILDARSRKLEIENRYSEEPIRYIRDGRLVTKAQFVDMVNNATPEELSTGQWGVENDSEVEQLLISKLPQEAVEEAVAEEAPATDVTQEEIAVEEPAVEVSAEEVATEEAEVAEEATEEVAEESAQELDTEAIDFEENNISDSEFRIEDLEEEIAIEKGNIKEVKAKAKEDTAAVRKTKLSKEEKAERIEEIKAELQDNIDDINGNIGIYKEDINALKSDIRKSKRKIQKLKTPKVPKATAKKAKTKAGKDQLDIKPFKKTNYIESKDLGKDQRTPKRFTEKEIKKLQTMVGNFSKILNRIGAQQVNITFASNDEQFETRYRELTGVSESAVERKGSFISEKGEIIVNLYRADIGTIAHEMTHAYVAAVKLSPKQTVDFVNTIRTELSKGNTTEVALAKRLTDFQNQYIEQEIYGKGKTLDDPIIAEEFLAEYAGMMFKFSENLSPSNQISFIEKVRTAVVKFLAKLGVVDKNLVAKIETREEALNFINGFVGALQGRAGVTADTSVEEQGESGEVGTISIPRKQIEVVNAPKAEEDSRDFVRKFVTDINIKELSGRKFVTNMYDYTNAGLTALGNGLSINLLGGRNYVPLMMSRNGKELGEVSNLAAFNTKAQAEGFIRNAKEGKADLFAPHSGTLTDSWQFQHHIFEELVNLVLDNKIMSKARLMETFNEAIKSKEGAKAFQAFNEKNKSKLKNLNSFKKNPMKLVELLNAENNYSPNLRKALNQKLAASKDFQQAIGIKNLNQFHNLIADPLNEGVSGGEIMTFVEFDPKSFEVVKPKPTDADFHPSFAWTVKAKIKRILQPNKYYKSYDLTEEYTKYNVSGPETSTKEDPKFAVSNVMSSAGAIPKVAKVDVARQQIDFAGIEMKTKETAGNTEPVIKTGGTAYVPVSTLYNLMDMRGGDRGGLYETAEDKKRVQKLVEAFKKEGFEYKGSDALYVDIDADGYGWIGEGNHRVLAARELGMSHLPVRVEFGAARNGRSIYKKDWSRVPTQVVSKEKIAELKEKSAPHYHIKYASIWETDLPTNPEPSGDVARQQIDWQPSLFGRGQVNPAIVNRTTDVQQAAAELLQGKITNAEYQEIVRVTQPIEAITNFYLPASTKDMQESLDKNKAKLLNSSLEDGKKIGLRLDIPAYKNRNIWVVSIHDKGASGKSLSYGSVAWATNVQFGSNPKIASFIAAGKNMDTLEKQSKSTIARMLGEWKNFEGKTKEEKDASAVKKVEEIVAIENSYPGAGRKGSPWRQIGMNPFRHSFFYDRRNGQPVIAAAEVVQIGGLVYAKDVVYADKSDPIFNVDGYKDANGETVRFQIEDRANEEANNEQTYDAVENNSQGLFDADVDAAVDADVSEMDSWKERPRTMFERFIDLTRLKIQDKFRKIIAVQEDIEFSKGAPVGLDEDFRNAEALMHGKAKEELNKTEIIVGKIAKLIKDSGLSIEKFNDILYAMHAQERNRYLRVISTDIGKSLMSMRKKKGMKPSEVAELLGISTQDYVDIEANKTALKTSDLADVLLIYGTTPSRFFYDNAKVKDGSGMTDVEARKILAEYGLDLASPDVSQLKPRIAIAVQAVRDLTADTRNRLLESGLETQDAIDAFTATYNNYVPLRGFADGELQSEMIEGGRKLEVRGREKRAKGRTTKADSPLTQVIISNTTTIVRAEKNSVMNRFYSLAVSNPNKDVYEIVDPKVTKEYKREIRNGKIVTTAKTIADYMSDPNMVSVRVGGEYKFIRFKDASLADALKGANVVKADWMVKYLGAFNRVLSSFITTYDPSFVFRNFFRDIQTAVINLYAEQEMTEGLIKDKSIVDKVVKDVFPAIKSIAIVEGGKSSKNKEMDQYYREFKEDGAKTEWFYSKSSKEVEKDIKNLIEGKGETAIQAAGNLAERINSAVENGVRLSTYVNARKAGVSRAKSAELAKELTVNFNKSGEWGQIGNTLFLFFNASVQGTSRLMRTLKPQYKVDSEGNRSLHITRAQKMAIGLSLMGSILSVLNELGSDDDEDDKSFYSKIPDFEKERNIIIMKPDGKTYWKLPLPYGLNVFYVTGTLLADAAQKIKTPGEVAGGIMQAVLGSFSPINFPNSDDTSKFLMKFVTPTIGQVPLGLAINENYFGQTIYNENFPFDTSPKPESELGRKGANRWTKELTRLLNKISGGSEFRSGNIDINPDKIDFVMESYSGGMGKFLSRSANTIDKIITGNWDQIEPRQVPFLRIFYGQSPKYANVQEFYTRSILVNQMQEEVKAGIISGAEAKRVSKVFYLGKNIRKQLSALKKREDVVMQIKDADVQREKMKKLEELRYKLVADYNKQYERFEIDKLK